MKGVWGGERGWYDRSSHERCGLRVVHLPAGPAMTFTDKKKFLMTKRKRII